MTAKFWLHVLTEIKNRGVGEALMVVPDGLNGLPQTVESGEIIATDHEVGTYHGPRDVRHHAQDRQTHHRAGRWPEQAAGP
ncbi:transposase [Nonomuraea insulae]|uniref:Transposase n=1 Tax=Nonomuraea insulae TaxID=1616787 RepID=A0ABW1CXP7_9ACTN